MLGWSGAIWSGLAAAAAAGFLFWWINSIHQVNGVGLIRRQGGPLSSPWSWVAIGFGVGMIVELVRSARRAGHAWQTRELADQLGREYAESYSLPAGASSLPVFAGWSDGRNAMSGREGHLPVTVFDYTTIVSGSESDLVTDGTAVLLPVDGLAAFDLRPRTLGRRVLGWAGFQGLTFDPAAADPIEAETVRRFTELFHLSAVDSVRLLEALAEDRPPDPDGCEGAIRQLFTPALMAEVNRYPGYAIQSRPGFLAVWHGSGVLPARKRTELWDAAVALRGVLTVPPDAGARPVVPGCAGTDASGQARRLRNTLVGGVVGLFAGFILAAMVMPLVFFGAPPGPGPGFFLLPVIFIGFILLGAAAGAGIGSRVPVRDLPPGPAEDPDRRKRRYRATRRGVLVGLFCGFFGGFVLFEGSKILFGWKADDFALEASLFFGSAFGGGLVGAVLCGTVVNWLYRRRPGIT